MPTRLPFKSLMVWIGPVVREQLVAADMDASQRRDRLAGGQLRDDPGAVSKAKIELAACGMRQRVCRNVTDVGEPFRTEQVLGDVHQGPTQRAGIGRGGAWSFPAALCRRTMPVCQETGAAGR